MYFSWLRAQLLTRGLLPKFQAMTNGSENEEFWADKVEAALGILVISERVPELFAFLTDFLPEGVTPTQILHSMSHSIRHFVGSHRGGKTRRKQPTSPPQVGFTLWSLTFDPSYITPLWENQGTVPRSQAIPEPPHQQRPWKMNHWEKFNAYQTSVPSCWCATASHVY